MFIIDYLITLGVYFALDFLWIRFIARKFNRKHIGYLLTNKPNRIAALIFYLLFTIGLLVFVINPSTSWMQAMLLGALFGLITYGTYDLINLATIKKWPKKFTVIDMCWGTFVISITSLISYLISSGI